MEALSLIDVAAEDDLLLDLASPPPPPSPHRDPPHAGLGAEASDLEPAGDSPAAGRVLDPDDETEQVPERSESPKQWKAKAAVNLRKSLAWDSAFFTSEGVLDTEELAIVNSTFRKAQGSRLPGITEETRRSGESTTSTLESESWVLESLDTELFDNVRASIQRSLGKPNKALGVATTTSKPPNPKATTNVPRVAARKGVDRMPQSKIRPPVSTSHGGVGGKETTQVTSKEPTASRVALQGAAEAKPSSRPPRALPRVATMKAPTNAAVTSRVSEKRSSTVNRQAVGKSANTSASMHSRPGGVTKSGSTKSGAFSSAAITPSHSVSMGTMPGAKTKSPTLSNKKRTAQRIPIRSSSRSDISKVNPARASRNKIPARSHGDHRSPSISPNSSLDSMSSVVSGVSTASTVGKMSHTSESFSTQSSSLSPSLRKRNDRHPTTTLRPTIVTERQSVGTASEDSLQASAGATTQGKGFKPSGLRMPTPKIGYFDAEKSIEQNIGAQVQVQPAKIQCSLPVTPKLQVSSTQMTNPASSTFSQQESKPTAAPHEESSASQSKASLSLPLRIAQMEVEPSKVPEHGACMRQTVPVIAVDTAKENIPALHQNIQAEVDASPLTVKLLTQKLSSISLGETPDLVS